MAYNEFAYFYDEFNGEADYDALYGYITDELKAHGITDGILADLGCGTGDLTLMLTQAGYDVIGIDRSEEMLSVLREKADELGLTGRLLLLKQDLLDLDLYGTIRAAVSTFDTYSHIGPQADAAGMGTTLMPRSWASRTICSPGSLMQGIPASLHRAQFSPASMRFRMASPWWSACS